MKLASTIGRYLLGLLFLVFGLNGFLHFIPMPMPPGQAGQYLGTLYMAHHLHAVWILQVLCGILLLVGFYVPLALTVLAGIIFNILFFHLSLAPAGLPPAVLATILWLLAFYNVRSAFNGIFSNTK